MGTVTQRRLQELLRYDPKTGDFYWKVQINPRAPVGALAGKNSKTWGYRSIGIDGVVYRAHRLVWLYFNGDWPTGVIDHINGNRLDNRIENLRDVSQRQNAYNLKAAKSSNKSGYLGVDWRPSKNKWRAQIRIDGKKVCVGHFTTAEDAHNAYMKAKSARDAAIAKATGGQA